MRDVKTFADFQTYIETSIAQALADPKLIHGQRVEAMFESLVVSLGAYTLLKAEDGHRLHAATGMTAPDFRIVLPDGAHWLVEVKNVYEPDPFQQRRKLMNAQYHRKLRAYADATGAELKLAVYWSRWSIWTLVSPDLLADTNGELDLDMGTAMAANEMARLGDRAIGARPPLRLSMVMDPDTTSSIGADGKVIATIKMTRLSCDGAELTHEVDRAIACIFIQYGEWIESEARPVVEDARLVSIEFEWHPREQQNVGFEMIGTLSRMFARYYADQTVAGGDVVQIRAPFKPAWFAPLVDSDRRSPEFPLWRFTIQPNYPAGASKWQPA